MSASAWRPPKPAAIGGLSASELEPLLKRLLESPADLTSVLATQTAAAMGELDEESRPDTFEGLLDVARYCVDDEPGWELKDKKQLVGGHPPIGATLAPGANISEESRQEQLKGGEADQATIDRLKRFNALYNKRYPGLAFVTFVAGRPRAVVADELEALLGKEVVDPFVSPESFPSKLVVAEESKEWLQEFERGYEALWQIAYDRAAKMAKQAEQPETAAAAPSASSASEPAQASTASADTAATKAPASTTQVAPASTHTDEKKEEPFITLATFRMLALSSPVLESFFEKDLCASFSITAPERSESGGAFAWHAAPVLPNSPRAIPGADAAASSAASSTGSGAAYSRDVTTGARGKVVGFLGGLLGEEGKAKMTQLADSVAQRLQAHTVTGPVPSFGRDRTLDGVRMDTAEIRDEEERRRRQAAEERSKSFGARLAGVVRGTPASAGGAYSRVPAPDSAASAQSAFDTGAPQDAPQLDAAPRGRGATREDDADAKARKGKAHGGATNLSELGPSAAVEALRQAAAQERAHFVIDEAGGGGAADGADAEADTDADDTGDADADAVADDVEDLALDDAAAAADPAAAEAGKEAGRLSGKEAQLAKDLRSAPAQQ